MGDWIAIVGSREQGREDVVRRLVAALQSAGVGVAGFVQTPRFDGEHVVGIDVMRLATGDRVPLAHHAGGADLDVCEWVFSPAAFETAAEWALSGSSAVCFVEAGRLEAAEGGHWATIVRSLNERPLTVLAIRPRVLASVALRLPDPVDSIELPADVDEIARFCVRVGRGCATEDPR